MITFFSHKFLTSLPFYCLSGVLIKQYDVELLEDRILNLTRKRNKRKLVVQVCKFGFFEFIQYPISYF
jgi:hypothetical protein